MIGPHLHIEKKPQKGQMIEQFNIIMPEKARTGNIQSNLDCRQILIGEENYFKDYRNHGLYTQHFGGKKLLISTIDHDNQGQFATARSPNPFE